MATFTSTGAATYATYGGSSTATSWQSWNDYYVITTSSATSFTNATFTWSGWNLAFGDNVTPVTVTARAPSFRVAPMSAEDREAADRLAKKAADDRAAAIAKAKALLHGFLTSEQIAQLAAQQWFEIVSQKGNRYRIHQGQVRNVRLVGTDGRLGTSYCIQPAEYVPDEDAMLAQKLLLESDEDAFVRIANKS